jgi:hypothetical protein
MARSGLRTATSSVSVPKYSKRVTRAGQKRLEAFADGKVQNGPAPDESGFRFGPIPGLAPPAGMRLGWARGGGGTQHPGSLSAVVMA